MRRRRLGSYRRRWVLPQCLLVDEGRSVLHGLGFVPVVWIKNLPGGVGPDGACTFRAAVETGIEIDYQLSQAGRGLKYSSDPTLLIKEPAGLEGELVRGAGNALVVSEKGDARLLEIGGTAAGAVLDYVRVPAGTGAGGGSREPGGCEPGGRAGFGAGLGADEPGVGVAGGQFAGFVWGRGAAAVVPDDPAGGGAVSVAGGRAVAAGGGCGGGVGAGLAALVSGEQRGPGSGCFDVAGFGGCGEAVDRDDGAALAGCGLGWSWSLGCRWWRRGMPPLMLVPGDKLGGLGAAVPPVVRAWYG